MDMDNNNNAAIMQFFRKCKVNIPNFARHQTSYKVTSMRGVYE